MNSNQLIDVAIAIISPSFGPVSFNFGRRSLEIALLISAKIFYVLYRIVLPIYCGMSVSRALGLIMFSDW